MVIYSRLKMALKDRLAGNRFAGNMLWMAMTQGIHRVARLAATLAAARLLVPEAFGLAAIVLTVHELMHAFTNSAVVPALVQAPKERLESLCQHAYRLNWLICVALMLAQVLVGWGASQVYDPALFWPIALLSLSFLCLPPGTIQAARVLRANRLNVVARAEMGQSIGEALLIAVLAIAGAGVWALVLPKLLMAPYWTWVYRRADDWTPTSPSEWRLPPALTRYSLPMISIELVNVLRQHMDYLLIGLLFSMDVLGIYYFAFNAGLGLSMGLLRAYSTALFPHLCAEDKAVQGVKMRQGMWLFARFAVPIILAQCVLAPFYVPVLFGADWLERGALPVLILICLSALPRIVLDTCAQGLRAAGLPGLDLKLQIMTTVLFAAGMACGMPWGLNGIATGILVSATLAAIPACIITQKRLTLPLAIEVHKP